MHLYGIDFTSAPRKSKCITIAQGRLLGHDILLECFYRIEQWSGFERFLQSPGPWLGGFDFPFGLPREAVHDLGWPTDWEALVRHCATLGKPAFKSALNTHRATRPTGQKYAHRRTDGPAGSHSPLKLVNPPVGLMFFEGAQRLLRAGVTSPGLILQDPNRIAVEAYPGFLARSITRASYKSDERKRHTVERKSARITIAEALKAGVAGLGLRVEFKTPDLYEASIEDGSGDLLDAVLALTQAAWCARSGPPHYGIPAHCDPLEGWIATAPFE